MRPVNTILFCLLTLTNIFAQNPFKQHTSKPSVEPQPLQIQSEIKAMYNANRLGKPWNPGQIGSVYSTHESVKSFKVTSSGSMWIELDQNQLWSSRTSLKEVIQAIVPTPIQDEPWALDWKVMNEEMDAQHRTHIRIQQTLAGHPIHRQDMILHLENGNVRDLNGFAWTGSLPEKLPDPLPAAQVLEAVKNFLIGKNIRFQALPQMAGLQHPNDEAQLVWYPSNGKLKLAYQVNIHPNMLDHWTVFINASTLEIIESYSQLCAISPLHLYDFSCNESDHSNHSTGNSEKHGEPMLVMDGATVTTDQDLLGQNRTVNGYQVGSNFFMIDASRPGMFQANQSVLPDEPVGVIWTIDANNSSPQQQNFEVIHVTNTNNNWKNLEVSAHFNAGKAYEYYLATFNRNAINGSGGNIISIINVTDQNDNDLDNAFWNGSAMFYGNGNVSYKELARGLDVAGHEMSHGVIGNTANLEYIGQSGAMNESFADIFGAMIDRDDWLLGEDVVLLSAFPSGALRDLSNPNNGGTNLNDPGWQPKHMNEFQNLPETPEGDNGGVHVNSGITNRAFFLLASAIGKEKAEQIYYKALTDYLVKSSQFIDLRIAVEKAATDRHGAGSAEVMAVRTAFDGVGIGAGQGGDYEDDIETNNGADFILATDNFQSDLYWVPPADPLQFVKMEVPAPFSRPSFTDDGTACVYVDQNGNMVIISFDWTSGLNFQWGFLDQQGIWRNVVVSKDGTKIAYTTGNLINEIYVYDFNTENSESFLLFNPSTATGGASTGDVLYADALEWDYSGEYIMYDALNLIESSFGDGIEYWDIGFLNAWDNAVDNFGSGQIGKLFSGLPENISVGNPTFSKNSPYIITFDFLEVYYDNFGQPQSDYRIKAANLETGELNDIYLTNTIGYPSFSRLDDKVLFTYDDGGSYSLATINIQASNKTLPVQGTDVYLINGAQRGVWFTTGNRIFTSTENVTDAAFKLNSWPQPANDFVTVSGEGIGDQSEYTILDMTGRMVQKGILNTDKMVQVGNLTNGTYLLEISGKDGQILNTRIVKQ